MSVVYAPLRVRIFQRAGYRCEKCGAAAPKDHPVWCGLDIHHRERTYNDHRDDRFENCVALCEACHYQKQNHSLPCPHCGRLIGKQGDWRHWAACEAKRRKEKAE